MTIPKLTLLLLTLLPSSLLAQQRPVYFHQGQKCVDGRYCTRGIGSSIFLAQDEDDRGWFITVGHILMQKNMVQVNNQWYETKTLKSLNVTELIPDTITVFRTKLPLSAGPKPTHHFKRDREPKVGDKVWLVGYPGGRYHWMSTVITKVGQTQFETALSLRSGASGGLVVFQDDNSLAGVIHAYYTNTGVGIYTRSDTILEFLRSTYPEIERHIVLPDPEPEAPAESNPVTVQTPEPEPQKEPLPPPAKDQELEGWKSQLKQKQEEYEQRLRDQESEHVQRLKEKEQQFRQEMESIRAEFEKTRPVPPTYDDSPRSDPKEAENQPVLPRLPNIPWDLIWAGLGYAGLAGAGLGGTGAGVWAIRKGIGLLTRGKKGGSQTASQDVQESAGFHRDVTEAEQILNLRQYEKRNPVYDALRGVLWEDELESDPARSLEETRGVVDRRFNQICPIATKTTTLDVSG